MLNEAGTEDIITELKNRSVSCIIAFEKTDGVEGGTSLYRYKGNFEACLGMCEASRIIIERDLIREMELNR